MSLPPTFELLMWLRITRQPAELFNRLPNFQ